MRRRDRVLAAVVLLLLVSACEPPESTPTTMATAEQFGPRGTVPAGMERFYGQALTWGACDGYARTDLEHAWFRQPDVRCARLTVPLDYANPQGDSITLGVLRRKASRPDQRIGSLVFGSGGPGVAGMIYGASSAQQAADIPLTQRFDFIGFDPRGIGAGEPAISCLTGAERDAWRTVEGPLGYTATDDDTTEARRRDLARKCVERTGKGTAMLANVGTRDVAKDLDVLRSALGDDKLTFVGYSYGTKLGATYAAMFPRNVRAMVLDGAVSPDAGRAGGAPGPTAPTLPPGNFQRAVDEFGQWCSARSDCPLRTQQVTEMTRPLLEHPVDAGDRRKLHYSDAIAGLVHAMYQQASWERLYTALRELETGKGEQLLRLADDFYHREPGGRYANTEDAIVAVHCVDDQRGSDRETERRRSKGTKDANPSLDDGRAPSAALGTCEFWPVPPTGSPLPDRAPDGLPSPLVISATRDAATPLEDAHKLAHALGGHLVTIEARQHTAFLYHGNRNKCVDDAAARYLVDLAAPPENLACR